MQPKRFQATREDFVCDRCDTPVEGNGYTNHCPECLWSKHVDIHPGDRAHRCRGLMEPIGTETRHGEMRILHRCTKCGAERWNKISPLDSGEACLYVTQHVRRT